MTGDISFQTRVSPPVAEHGTPPVPRGHPAVSSPLTSTLILTGNEALLVDPPWHVSAVADTIRWIADSGRTLTKVYITHGHGDHWFGASAIISAFPEAAVFATRATMAYMHDYARERPSLWDSRFPGVVSAGHVSVRVLTVPELWLGGTRVDVLELGHTDTDDTTALWAADAGLLVAGDSVYNRCHLAMNEAADGGAERWLAALGNLAALNPRHVVAGHKHPGAPEDPVAIEQTRRYICDFMDLYTSGVSALDLFDQMLARYPGHANPKALWRGICALPEPSSAWGP